MPAVNSIVIRGWAGTVARLVLAVVWVIAGWQKLHQPRDFVRAVRAYDATPEWLSSAIGYGLPVLEICVALLLLFGLATRVTAAVSGLLFLVFVVGIGQAAARGIKLDCGCFGGGGATDHTTYLLDVGRDLGLLVLSVFLVLWPLTRLSVDRQLRRGEEIAPPSAKRVRRDPKAIARYQAVRAARHRELVGQQRYIAATVAAVVVLVSIIGVSVQSNRAKVQGTLEAANASVTSGVTIGKASAPVTVDLFEDFQCPVCQQLETSAGTTLASMVSAGKIKINYHMMAFLDQSSSGNRYSSRAANAALCASDASVDDFAAYHKVLYGKNQSGQSVQPAEGGNGRTNAELISYFAQAVPKASPDQKSAFASCVQTEQHSALVQAVTDNSSKRNVNATPTVKVNGKDVKSPTKDSIVSAVNAAAKS